MNALKLAIVFIGGVSILLNIFNLMVSRRKSIKAVWVANIIIQLLCVSVTVYELIGG